MHYYNEIDTYCVDWLENLIEANLLLPGLVDERSISQIQGSGLCNFNQVHLFAGIGGWPLALQIANWPEDIQVWTGSCPCQPFSNAGKRKNTTDERHLWPEFKRLINICRPPVIFGEQVASPLGREWLSGVRIDLEKMGYAVGAADLCAASTSAPHIRQRLFWVGITNSSGWKSRQQTSPALGQRNSIKSASSFSRLANTNGRNPSAKGIQRSGKHGQQSKNKSFDFWNDFELISCADKKSRRIESGTFPLAHGIPRRVGKLRAYGNAIVPQVAVEFITVCMEIIL